MLGTAAACKGKPPALKALEKIDESTSASESAPAESLKDMAIGFVRAHALLQPSDRDEPN